jgi:class 3 adenylate cyclase/RecA/RadA recombinase
VTADPTCGACGTAQRAHAKFCDECGARLATVADPSEYKQVTVLFADVVRSMAIASAVDLERLREIMTEFLERAVAVVQRFGGIVEYHGDGIMALFGAPIALEDHAFRGCLAALAIQDEAHAQAEQIQLRDELELRVRVGLNSGRVIVGELGITSLGYAATGATVGFAQRMEAAAPPGGVMLSEATARLVEHAVSLSDPEPLHVKGHDGPVCGRRLLGINPRDGLVGRTELPLVGRRWELAALDAVLERTGGHRGGIVNVVGPPGIGKSRIAREAAALAASRGIEVSWAYCESHARDVPFYAMTRLLRAGSGIAGLDGDAARARLREHAADADPEDLLLLDDLVGIADPDVAVPQIDPEARRRRLTALINSATLARTAPALLVVEDVHWIDAISESMLDDLLTVVSRSPLMILITYRPEYDGPLTHVHGAQTIALAPLADSDTGALLVELLGSGPSVAGLAAIIADRAAGNPFFAEEMVRELVQRGALTGARGEYFCGADTSELDVPATVQAAIEARIDRLSQRAKRTLAAASVIGARFESELLASMGIDVACDELLSAELIDQVRFMPDAEYAFRHPLIRAVAYEAQLKSDRAEWHRRLAAAIEQRVADSTEKHSALIAEHLRAAGDLPAAYAWHMRAGAWSVDLDVGAARVSWERAAAIADQLPDGDDVLTMRITPRTMLCVTDWQAHVVRQSWGRFAELRELCTAAGDKVSLAIGMTGLASELLYAGLPGEGSRLASEQMVLLESIGDPSLTIGLSFVAFANWFNSGEFGEILRWSQTVIDLADGDATKGAGFGIGSPLAVATAFRGLARWWLGHPGWPQDLADALTMAQDTDPTTVALVVAWTQGAMVYGVLRPDAAAIRAVEDAARIAEATSKDFALVGAKFALGIALLQRDDPAERRRGVELTVHARDTTLPQRAPSLVPLAEVCISRELARSGDRDTAIAVMRRAVAELHQSQRLGWLVCCQSYFVETLLERGTDGDVAEARAEIERMARAPGADAAICETTLLRVRALLAKSIGDDAAYRSSTQRYLRRAETHGYEGHVEWARAMQKDC